MDCLSLQPKKIEERTIASLSDELRRYENEFLGRVRIGVRQIGPQGSIIVPVNSVHLVDQDDETFLVVEREENEA